MAPELLLNMSNRVKQAQYSPAIDVYSFGITLYGIRSVSTLIGWRWMARHRPKSLVSCVLAALSLQVVHRFPRVSVPRQADGGAGKGYRSLSGRGFTHT